MMNKFKYIILLLLSVNLLVMTSCTDTYEVHQKYLEDGETIYTNKVDSVVSLTGDSRLQLSGYISNAFNVQEIVVYWNNEEDFQKFPYEKSDEFTDPLDLIIVDLEESTYQFDIYSVDIDGNRSVKVTTFGTAYGEIYRSNLEARLLKSFYLGSTGDATINFNIKSELTRNTEVSFTNLSGEEIVAIVGKDEESAILVNIDISKEVMYRTFYVPSAVDEETGEETSIDQFASDWTGYTLPTVLEPIADSFTFSPVLGGVISNWENPDGLTIIYEFRNTVGGSVVSNSVISSELTDSYEIREMEAGSQDIEIVISDVYGNSYARAYTVEPVGAYDRSLWSIIDFSSEEPKEATWGGGGQAIHAIDADLSTFWHSQWDLAQPDYPHHITVDFGEELSILAFEILGRSSNNHRGAGVHEFWGSTDNVNWTLILTHTGELSTSKVLIEAPQTTARYLRYVATERGSGDTNYTFLADLAVYAVN